MGRVPASLAQPSPKLQLSFVSKSAVSVCVLHVSEDRTWQAKEVTLSALPADPGLNVVTAVAAHPGAAPLSLSTLSNMNTPLCLTLCVWH
jgi:hypothetical protein